MINIIKYIQLAEFVASSELTNIIATSSIMKFYHELASFIKSKTSDGAKQNIKCTNSIS